MKRKLLCIIVAALMAVTMLPAAAIATGDVPPAVDITTISYANGAVSLAWASADGVDGYRVYRKTGTGKWTTALASTTATSWVDNTVTEGKTYSYTVRSYVGKNYSAGYNDTAKTITAKAAAVPVAVDITSISYANGAVSLAWSEADGVDGYRVYRKTGTGKWTTALASTTATSWVDNTVTEGKTYSYTIRSYVGKNYSAGYNDTAKTITAKAAAVPVAVDITSIEYANGAVSLAWSEADGVDGYRVYRKTGTGKWTTALASTTETSWVDNTVTEGATYSYTVRSYVGKEYSTGYNDTAKTITAKAAAVPVAVDITSIEYANGAVSLAWSEADGVDGYRVYRKTGTGKWTTALASTTETSWTDNTVTEGATYSYTVRSYVGKEYSTGYNDTAKTITAKAAAVPAAVDITSISYANGTVSLAWASADGVDGYRVYRKTGAGKWTTALASTTETSWTDNTVTEGKTYSYTVRSYVGKEYSTGYNDTAKTITAKAAGPAPVDITSISAYRARVVIEWESRDDVEGYRVYRKTDGGKWVSLGDLSKWTASYTDNPPELGHTYTYAVRSRIGNTYSADYVQRAKSIYLSDEAPAEATITGAELCDDGVHLSWISTDGADSYNRYKKTGDGEWTPIIYDLSGTEWIDSDVVSGAQISYAVQAIRNRIPSENYLNTAVTVDVPASFIPCSYWMVITEIKASGTNSFTIRGYDKFGYTETKTIAANARGGLFERTDAQSTDKGKESALTYANVTAAFDRAAGASGEALMFCEYSINENYKVTALRVYTGAPEMIDTSGGYESYFCEYENRDTEFFGGRFRGDLMRTRILRFDAAGKKVTALRDRLPDVGTGAMKLLSYRVIEGDFLYAAAIVTGKGSFTDYGGNEPETQAASDVIGYLRSIEKYDDHYEYVAAYGKSGGNICQSRKSGDPDEVAEKDGLLVFDDWNNTLGRNAGMAMFDMRNDGTVFNMRVLSDMTTAPAGKKSEHLSAFIVEDFVRSGNAVTGLKLRPLSGKYVNVSGKPKNGGALWTAEEKAGIFAEYDAAQSVVFDLGKNATVLIINPDTTNQAMTLPGSVTELFRASTDNSGRITGGMVVTLSYDGEAGEIVTVFANEILVK